MDDLQKFLSGAPIGERTDEEKTELCALLREKLIKNVSHSGGHLASNLGIVEATVAIHSVFDTEKDRLVFDVGHQSYVHKLLTGRCDSFSTLRRLDGISGFPNPAESVHDAFIAGHASNSVSVALGLARARTLHGEDHQVIALIGDGSLTGGLAYEGINDLGDSGEHVIVILNDNGMSISKNVGGISRHLALLRLKPGYFGLKKAYNKITQVIPGGKAIYAFTHKIKTILKRSLIGTTLFEEIGITYLGPVDGHDLKKMTYLLGIAKEMEGPVLLHIITQKGKGYRPAERFPQEYHGVGKFDPGIGLAHDHAPGSFSAAFGEAMTETAQKDPNVCAITAAMRSGVGLDGFAASFPDRFYDVGIAEGHAVTMASGMAKGGLCPVVAVYSTFLQRAFDMLIHDTAIQQLHVVFWVDRCGLVGEDGVTHQGVFDVGFLRQIPGMTILAPTKCEDVKPLLHYAIYECAGPVAIRAPRGGSKTQFPLRELSTNPAVTLVSYGAVAEEAYLAACRLREEGVEADFICLPRLKPIDSDPVLDSVRKSGALLVAEDVVENGCIGKELACILEENGINASVCLCNLKDSFVPHGSVSELRRRAELDADSLYRKAREVVKN